MKYKVDVVRIRENSITLNGWALGNSPESKVTFRVEDEHHQPVKCKMVSTRRDDVSQIYFKKVIDKEFGFDIQFPYERGKSYWLLIRCDGRQAKIKYNEELITKRASVAHKRMEKIKDLMNMETVHVALDFWKENGLRALIKKSCHKIQGLDNDYDYGEWYGEWSLSYRTAMISSTIASISFKISTPFRPEQERYDIFCFPFSVPIAEREPSEKA